MPKPPHISPHTFHRDHSHTPRIAKKSFIFNFSMLNGARVQRHLLKSIIFCTTFFSLDNKKVVVFFALGNSNDLPTFFYWFTCNPKRLFCASLGVIDGLWVCWAAARLRDSRRSFTTPAQTSHHNTHIKLCHQPPKASEHELKLFLKKNSRPFST